MCSKPYRNDRIVTVLRALFFTGGSSSYAHRYAHKFPVFMSTDGVAMRGVPKPMVALVATAVRVRYQKGIILNKNLSYMQPSASGARALIRLLISPLTPMQMRTRDTSEVWIILRPTVLMHIL
jgi:hypothetical protein